MHSCRLDALFCFGGWAGISHVISFKVWKWTMLWDILRWLTDQVKEIWFKIVLFSSWISFWETNMFLSGITFKLKSCIKSACIKAYKTFQSVIQTAWCIKYWNFNVLLYAHSFGTSCHSKKISYICLSLYILIFSLVRVSWSLCLLCEELWFLPLIRIGKRGFLGDTFMQKFIFAIEFFIYT